MNNDPITIRDIAAGAAMFLMVYAVMFVWAL